MNSTTDSLNKPGFKLPEIGADVLSVSTPALIVDKTKLQANIKAMFQETFGRVAVRPHLKTGKSPIIAKMLLEEGACGICVAKTGEAEIMCDAGIESVLVTSPVAHPTTARWLAGLFKKYPKLLAVVDSEQTASLLSEALVEVDARAHVLLDVNVGQNRTGIAPDKAVELAGFVARLDRMKIIGVQGYEGHLQMLPEREKITKVTEAMQALTKTADRLRQFHEISIVTTGGTGTYSKCMETAGVTEIQPGSFIFMDKQYNAAIGNSQYASALFVLTTVISKPSADLATIDGGWKTFSTECGMPEALDAGLVYAPAGDEHGQLTGPSAEKLRVGEQVCFIPSHIDTTVANHEYYIVVENGCVQDIWTIETRGRVQ